MPAGIELMPITLPGHDGRLNEPPFRDIASLTNWLADDLSRDAIDRPFVLLGHSMGALVAFELARVLRRRNLRMPSLLALTGCAPPQDLANRDRLHSLPDDELLASLDARYGGVPPMVRDHPALLKLLLPALRADLQIIETYQCIAEPPLDVPMLVLGGADDPAVSASQLVSWGRYTTEDCSARMLPGGHFFLFHGDQANRASTIGKPQAAPPALRMILARLESCLTARSVEGRD